MLLSEHFTLEEVIHSNEGLRAGIDNNPPPEVLSTLKQTCFQMEALRNFFKHPIIISSGYRCQELNTLVGGVSDSAHIKGYAMDFIIPTYGTPLAIAKAVTQSGIRFDQIIKEYGWVHISFAPEMRGQILTKRSKSSPYENGLMV